LAKLAQEGGVDFINYLLAKAVADDGSLPNTSSPKEWTFRDILRMPKQQQVRKPVTKSWSLFDKGMSSSSQSSLRVAKRSKTDGYSTSKLMVVKRLDLLLKVFPKSKA
jgi:hypothetical protein